MDYSNFTPATYSPPTTLPNHQPSYITHTQHSRYHAHTFTHNTTHTILEQQTTTLPNHFYHQQPTQHYSISSSSPNPYFPPQTYQQQPQPSYSSFPTQSPLPNSYPLNVTPSSTSFPPYYQQQPQTLNPSLPPSRLEIKLSIFDGSEDAYWWIICSEKSFNSRNRRVSDAERLMKCSFAMKGSALTWWLSWYLANPKRSWDSFTCALLWHFKPEWRPILPIEGEEEEATTENEKAPEQLEEESAFIASVQEQTEEQKKLVAGGDLQIIQKEDKEKEQDSETHRDFLSTSLSLKLPLKPPPFMKSLLLPPPEPPDVKFLSETVSAPPLATRPPSKPPDVHSSPENFQFQPPVFLIAQSQPLAPLYSSTSLLINSLPRPPETVSSLLPASPPPLKPPDLHLPLEVFLPPPALLPPPKPPDRYFRRPKLLDVQPPYNFYRTALCLSSAFLKNVKMENSTIDPCDIVVLHVKFGTTSQPLDHFIPILLQSQLCHKTTICLKPSQPTTNSHVSKFAPPTTIHARDILFSPYFYVSARCLQLQRNSNHIAS
ncbi:hypothetical protein QL285_053010 [Trifolium repens]|nr:hypothetical protein QL285_053010 [Trifolium repens]